MSTHAAPRAEARSTQQPAGRNGFQPRVFLQPIAAPSVLGLFGFAGATLIVAANLAGWYGTSTSPTYLAPFVATFGGLAQLLAGMWSYRARDALATAMHGTWGAFWIGYGILYLLIGAGTIPAPFGASFPELGFWFIALAAITWSGAITAAFESLGLLAVLSTLATGSTLAAIGMIGGYSGVDKAAGWLLVFSAGFAWYVATAMMLTATTGKTILPTGKYKAAANVPGQEPVQTIELEWGEPGIKHGQ